MIGCSAGTSSKVHLVVDGFFEVVQAQHPVQALVEARARGLQLLRKLVLPRDVVFVENGDRRQVRILVAVHDVVAVGRDRFQLRCAEIVPERQRRSVESPRLEFGPPAKLKKSLCDSQRSSYGTGVNR